MKSSTTNRPPPLPLPPTSPVLTPLEKSTKKAPLDEREKFFLLYENEGKVAENLVEGVQQQQQNIPRLSRTDPNSIDHYGFIHDQPVQAYSIAERKQFQQELKRSERWMKMLKKGNSTFQRTNEQLRRRIFKGLPSKLRGAFWSRLFNLDEQLRINKGHYDLLKKKARASSTYLSQIDVDVHRTYRNHQMFCNRYSSRQKDLFSILAAYSVYNTEIGYTQGMNQIVAFLLFYLPEEEAFWAFCQLMTSSPWMMHGLFCPGFPKLFRFQAQFEKIMKKMLPKVYKHFLTYQVQTDLYTIRWFMLCYLDCLPFPLTLRIWDIFVLDGEQVLLTTAFCILRIHRKKILHLKTFDSINTFLKHDLCANFANSTLTIDEIIEEYIVCYEKLKQNNLLTLPPASENEYPSKPFNISMGDIAALTTKKSLTPDETTNIAKEKNPVSPTVRRTSNQTSTSPKTTVIPTFHVTSSSPAPLATLDDDDFPSQPVLVGSLRDTSIEEQYNEAKRLVKPTISQVDQSYLTEYDSCTILSSADPSISGYRRRTDRNGRKHTDDDDEDDDDDDDRTISSKSEVAIDDDDEHVQISQIIHQSFPHYPERREIERSPSFYDNMIEGEQCSAMIYRQYPFETDIR